MDPSIDQLIHMFRSVSIVPEQSMEYTKGYDEGYNNGYNDAYEEIYGSQTTIVKTGKPPFGWKVVSGHMIQNEEEQIIIEVIRRLIRSYPEMRYTDISRWLTAQGFKIRKSAMIYPATVRNIIMANNLKPN